MPIIGRGLIARNLQTTLPAQLQDTLFFACGVSNSLSASSQDYARELALLQQYTITDSHLVYFGTCSIYDSLLSDTPYVKHKLKVENILKKRAKTTVIRFPQVIGNPPNPFTLCSFLHSNIVNRQRFQVWSKAKRYLIDIDDALGIMYEILPSLTNRFSIVDIAPPDPVPVLSIVHTLEQLTGIKAIYSTVDKGDSYCIDLSTLTSIHPHSIDRFGSDYVNAVLSKYFARSV